MEEQKNNGVETDHSNEEEEYSEESESEQQGVRREIVRFDSMFNNQLDNFDQQQTREFTNVNIQNNPTDINILQTNNQNLNFTNFNQTHASQTENNVIIDNPEKENEEGENEENILSSTHTSNSLRY